MADKFVHWTSEIISLFRSVKSMTKNNLSQNFNCGLETWTEKIEVLGKGLPEQLKKTGSLPIMRTGRE